MELLALSINNEDILCSKAEYDFLQRFSCFAHLFQNFENPSFIITTEIPMYESVSKQKSMFLE